MRTFFAVVLALVAGLVIGAWQPRGEVLELRAQLDEAREKAAKQTRRRGIEEIQGLLNADPPQPGRRVTRKDSDGLRIEANDDGGGAPPVNVPPGGSPGEQLDVLRSGLDARRAHALEALGEQADLDADARAAVDQALAAMNEALRGEVDSFVKDVLADGDVERRDAMEFAANALDIVITADDALRAAMPEESYDALDDELRDPLAYVTGDTVAALSRIADLPLPD